MQRLTKIVLAAAFVGTLGLSGLLRSVNAKQAQSPVAVMPQHHSSTQVAQSGSQNGIVNPQGAEEANEGGSETKESNGAEAQSETNKGNGAEA